MYLVADSPSPDLGYQPPPNFARWSNFPVSQLSHHGQTCCDIARHWFRAADFAQLNGNGVMSGPRWIREKFEWGPSNWPVHWCETLEAEVIDCGAHAALAHEAFESRGVTAFRTQVVQGYESRAIDQWRLRWDLNDASDHWLGDDCIYHEVNAVVTGPGILRLWDGSSGCWLDPAHSKGYGSVIAVRISTPLDTMQTSWCWGKHRLPASEWHDL
jgi:hypothetical protein